MAQSCKATAPQTFLMWPRLQARLESSWSSRTSLCARLNVLSWVSLRLTQPLNFASAFKQETHDEQLKSRLITSGKPWRCRERCRQREVDRPRFRDGKYSRRSRRRRRSSRCRQARVVDLCTVRAARRRRPDRATSVVALFVGGFADYTNAALCPASRRIP
jgi:hypothetical protein